MLWLLLLLLDGAIFFLTRLDPLLVLGESEALAVAAVEDAEEEVAADEEEDEEEEEEVEAAADVEEEEEEAFSWLLEDLP